MNIPASLDDRISALAPEINEPLRKGLQRALRALRDAGDVVGTLANVSKLIEGHRGLLGIIAAAVGQSLSDNSIKRGVKAQINELNKSNIIQDIVEDLTWIREKRNPVMHNTEEMLTIDLGETALERCLHAVEWFYCQSKFGPHLSNIYETNYQPITLLGRVARFDSASAHFLKLMTMTLALDDAGNTLLREGADPNQLKDEPYRLVEMLERAQSRSLEMVLYIAYWASIDHDFHGRRKAARQVLDDALELENVQAQNIPLEWQIRVLNRAAHLAIKQADCTQAEEFANRMLKLGQETEQNLYVATAFQRLGRLHYFRCDSNLARELLEKSLMQFESLEPKDFRGIAWVQFDLGMLEVDLGNYTSARDWLEKSLILHEKYGDRNEEGTVRVNLAFALHKQGERATARVQMGKAADILRRENYFRWYLHFLGRLELDEGDLESARQHLFESWGIFRDREDKLGIIRSLLGFSWLAARKGDLAKAVTLLCAEDVLRSTNMGLPFPLDWRTEKDFIEATAHDALGETAFELACARGRAMTWEQAVENSFAQGL